MTLRNWQMNSKHYECNDKSNTLKICCSFHWHFGLMCLWCLAIKKQTQAVLWYFLVRRDCLALLRLATATPPLAFSCVGCCVAMVVIHAASLLHKHWKSKWTLLCWHPGLQAPPLPLLTTWSKFLVWLGVSVLYHSWLQKKTNRSFKLTNYSFAISYLPSLKNVV